MNVCHKRLLGIGIITAVCCTLFFFLTLPPSNILSCLDINPYTIDLCYYLFQNDVKSTDLTEDELIEFIHILEKTEIEFIERYSNISSPNGTKWYSVYLRGLNKKSITFTLSSDGYFYFHYKKYRLIDGTDLMDFLVGARDKRASTASASCR